VPSKKDRTGQRFGRLTVIEDVGRKLGSVLWRCRCDCGKTIDVRSSALVSGAAKTCATYGECHHKWKGGRRNVGSVAWVHKKLGAGRSKSEKYGYLPPEKNPDKVIALWKESNGTCMACGSKPGICMDHCHDTGEIRGFLCHGCNKLLGFAKSSQDTLLGCIRYLRRIQS
jgi:hypothetical protein